MSTDDTPPRLVEHPGLTIKIYRVNPETMERTDVRDVALEPSNAPIMTTAFPPCTCLLCRARRRG